MHENRFHRSGSIRIFIFTNAEILLWLNFKMPFYLKNNVNYGLKRRYLTPHVVSIYTYSTYHVAHSCSCPCGSSVMHKGMQIQVKSFTYSEPVLTVTSDFCSWLAEVEPNRVLCYFSFFIYFKL